MSYFEFKHSSGLSFEMEYHYYEDSETPHWTDVGFAPFTNVFSGGVTIELEDLTEKFKTKVRQEAFSKLDDMEFYE